MFEQESHDAFFTHIADVIPGRLSLKEQFSKIIEGNHVMSTLDEMKRRGLPDEIYRRKIKEAIELGIIPEAGVSTLGGRIVEEKDILKSTDIDLSKDDPFAKDFTFYGIN